MSNKTLDVGDALLNYILSAGVNESDIAFRLREETSKLEMSRMQIAPEQGAFMAFIAKLLCVENYLEIGVFTGYSMLSVVSAMGENARAVGCDVSYEWTDIAQKYWQEAGISKSIDLQIAPAIETLKTLQESSFDLAFIDADKESYDSYYESCLKLLKPGALLMIDNIFWGGAVADEGINDMETLAIRKLNSKIMSDTRVDASMLSIGDGIMMVRKR